MKTLTEVLSPMLEADIQLASSNVRRARRSHSMSCNPKMLSRSESKLRKLKQSKWGAEALFSEFDVVDHTRTEMLAKFEMYSRDFERANKYLCSLSPYILSTRFPD